MRFATLPSALDCDVAAAEAEVVDEIATVELEPPRVCDVVILLDGFCVLGAVVVAEESLDLLENVVVVLLATEASPVRETALEVPPVAD